MRTLYGLLALMQIFIVSAPLLAQKTPPPTPPPAEPPPSRETLRSASPSDIEGKTLSQWLTELKHTDPSNREYAIRIIPLFGPATTEVVGALLDRCNERDPSLRVRAIMSFQYIDVPKQDTTRIVEVLARHAKDDTQLVVRYQAVISLLRFGDAAKAGMDAFIVGASYENSASAFEMRHACVSGIITVGRSQNGPPDVRATCALLSAIKDPAARVRQEAAMGLGSMGKPTDPQVLQAVEAVLHRAAGGPTGGDRDMIVRIWANVGLAILEKPTDAEVKVIANATINTDPKVRFQAARAIGILGSKLDGKLTKAAAAPLVDLARGKEPLEICMACWALSELNDPGAEALKTLVDLKADDSVDKSGTVKAAAEEALKKIKQAGQPPQQQPKK